VTRSLKAFMDSGRRAYPEQFMACDDVNSIRGYLGRCQGSSKARLDMEGPAIEKGELHVRSWPRLPSSHVHGGVSYFEPVTENT
jgi:hypothetical protein